MELEQFGMHEILFSYGVLLGVGFLCSASGLSSLPLSETKNSIDKWLGLSDISSAANLVTRKVQ